MVFAIIYDLTNGLYMWSAWVLGYKSRCCPNKEQYKCLVSLQIFFKTSLKSTCGVEELKRHDIIVEIPKTRSKNSPLFILFWDFC